MRLSFPSLNLPAVFSKLNALGNAPPKSKHTETRSAADALDYPNVQFYNPDALHFPNHNWAVPYCESDSLPGNGGYVTQGLGMVTYDHQATWNRCDASDVGPVREFFRAQSRDNSIRRAG